MKRYYVNKDGRLEESDIGHLLMFSDAAGEIHALNNKLTAVTLERDNAIRDSKAHHARYTQIRTALRNLLESHE